MIDNPEKFKQLLADKQEELAHEEKKLEDVKAETPVSPEGDQAQADPGTQGSARSKQSVKQKEKRPPMEKQEAYLEFKQDLGKPIEASILQNREEIKEKRVITKDITVKINSIKGKIDQLSKKLEKKEDERKMNTKHTKMQMEAFEDDEDNNEEIIDEEELVMLKDMKDLKRDYRDSYSKLKGLKQELSSLQYNIDAQKEQLIFQFENWYADEFKAGAISGQVKALDLGEVGGRAAMKSGGGIDSSAMSANARDANEDAFEDEDAAVYRRAKNSVDELHRARKFEKSIKL